MRLKDIIENVRRDGIFSVLGIIDSATELPMLSFIDNEKYLDALLQKKNIRCVITTEQLASRLMRETDLGIAVFEQPRLRFFELHQELKNSDWYRRKEIQTTIHETAKISKQAYISEYNVKIGPNVVIEPFVMIYPNVEIGANSIIRAGAVLGGEGFECKRDGDKVISITHLGGVIIGENVEIQNNTCIDKAVYPWDNTVIGDYVKIDNLVHVAHAVKIGHGTMLVANAGIGGRVEIAPNTWIGFGATIRNGLKIEDGGRVNMGAVVTKDVKQSEAVTGNFAIEHSRFMQLLKDSVK